MATDLNLSAVHHIVEDRKNLPGALLPILHEVQEVLGHVPAEAVAIIAQGLNLGIITIESGSLWLPIFIIGVVYVPYVARPVRGQVLALRESEFVLAAIGLGVPSHRILLRDILPNVSTTLIVFVPIMMALNMITESALSFLSIGVQPPDASWGTIIQDGQTLLYTRPMVALAPGIAHKNDAGLVVLGLVGEAAVREAYSDLSRRLSALKAGRIILQPMAPARAELILGIAHEPPLGHFLVLGLGGLHAELLDSVVLIPVFVSRARLVEIVESSMAGELVARVAGGAARGRGLGVEGHVDAVDAAAGEGWS